MDLDAYARDWAALRRAALEDYRLLPRHLHALQERIGRQFDFDCCCNDDGSNAHAPRFASPSRSFLDQGTDIRGMCVWMNAPFSMLGAFIAAYVERKRLDPSTCGCILVPKWAGPWRKLMRGMQLVAEYPVGTVLFDKPCGEDARCELPGVPWPVQVFWDPPRKKPKFGSAGEVAGLTMCFAAELGKHHKRMQATLLADSGASHGFVPQRVVDALQLPVRRSPHAFVGLADGGDQALLGQVEVPLTFGGRMFAYPAFVMEETVPGVDLIIGDDWMTGHAGSLVWGARPYIRFEQNGVRIVEAQSLRDTCMPTGMAVAMYCMYALAADRRARSGVGAGPVFMSARQVRKMLRDPQQQAMVVWVQDQTRYAPSRRGGGYNTVQARSLLDDRVGGTYMCAPKCSPRYTCAAAATGSPTPGPQPGLIDELDGPTDEPSARAEGPRIGPSDISEEEVRSVLARHTKVTGELEDYERLPARNPAGLLDLEPGKAPPCRPVYRMSPAELEELKRHIADLLKRGYIQPSRSPFGAPVLFAPKPGGGLRLCVDYRMLNAITVKNRYPLPRIDDLLDKLHGARYFSTMDLASGFYQIRIAPEDMPKTAFRTPIGHFEFRVLPMGLANCPSTFQNVMNDIFSDLIGKGVLIYLDDIMIYAETKEEHLRLLDTVLGRLERECLRVKLTKCHFAREEVKFLGHIVGRDGVQVDPAKTKTVAEWPVPKDVKDVRKFLGLCNYFRKFIQGYSTLVSPLTDLTASNAPWVWGPPQQQAFEALKQALCNEPLLALPDYSVGPDGKMVHPFHVVCDASVAGVGGVLMQNGRPLAYFSKKFIPAEVNYTTTDQELLAVVCALMEWRCYLEGVEFVLTTDHQPLTYLQSLPTLSRRQARWSEYLQRFGGMQWKHIPGRTNVADPVSRIYCARACLRTGHQLKPGEWRQVLRARGVWFATARVTRRKGPATRTLGECEDVLECIKAGYATDTARPKGAALGEDGLWRTTDGRVCVPDVPGLRLRLLRDLHDAPSAGHGGVKKTLDLVQRDYWWDGVRKDVEAYVRACDSCQRMKASNQKPAGLLVPLQAPKRKWGSVTMDFVGPLPRTQAGHMMLLVVVDRLTKMAHFIPMRDEDNTASGVARLFMKHVVRLHGVPYEIISDRDSKFTSLFWEELWRRLGVKRRLSTAYHPQTDGQTERMNRTLEDMLRHYISPTQDNWEELLDMAEFAVNNSYQASIQTTPFMLTYGVHPAAPLSVESAGEWRNPAAEEFAAQMAKQLERAQACLEAARARMKTQADKKRAAPEPYKVGQMVMLSTKNIELKSVGTRKLLPRFIGPFAVKALVGEVAVELELPSTYTMHNVFHVALVKPYNGKARLPPPCDWLNGDPLWTVERLLDHRKRKNKTEFLVKWEGYGPEHNTWEPEKNLITCDELKKDYWASLEAAAAKPAEKRKAAGLGPGTRKRTQR